MYVRCSGAASEEIHAAPSKFAGARTGEKEVDAAFFDKKVNFIEQNRRTPSAPEAAKPFNVS
jgi:hypothetical protein